MDSVRLFTTLKDLSDIEATLDEQDSHFFLANYQLINCSYYRYSTKNNSFEDLIMMTEAFAKNLGSIRQLSNSSSFYSPRPLGIFRYLMLSDGSWSHYKTISRKDGYVVEGAYWSNGLFYHVRKDSIPINPIEIVLFIDSITKTFNRFPDTYDPLYN